MDAFREFSSFLQSHPFVVTSWSPEEQTQLELFVEPRRGLTRALLYHTQAGEKGAKFSSRWVLFSGPHGITAFVGEYESVLMTGFGMAALLPYLSQLIHGYQTRKIYTRRIRVIWQVQRIGKQGRCIHTNKTKLTTVETALAMQPLLNSALKGDKQGSYKERRERCW